MKWEDLTAPDFATAVEDTGGVCVVPIGVIEKHGEHLPLGTDTFVVSTIAERAANIEPAIVFPFYYLGQIHEAKQCPGTIAIRLSLALDLLQNICAEIARNGLHKIVLVNGHGGNGAFLSLFTQAHLEEPRDYTLYVVDLQHYYSPVLADPEWTDMMVSEGDSHAGETETSDVLAIRPELVKMEAIPADPAHGSAQRRATSLTGLKTPIDWYADYPNHYAGDARAATPAKGEWLMDRFVSNVARLIRVAKEDSCSGELQDEYFSRIRHGEHNE